MKTITDKEWISITCPCALLIFSLVILIGHFSMEVVSILTSSHPLVTWTKTTELIGQAEIVIAAGAVLWTFKARKGYLFAWIMIIWAPMGLIQGWSEVITYGSMTFAVVQGLDEMKKIWDDEQNKRR